MLRLQSVDIVSEDSGSIIAEMMQYMFKLLQILCAGRTRLHVHAAAANVSARNLDMEMSHFSLQNLQHTPAKQFGWCMHTIHNSATHAARRQNEIGFSEHSVGIGVDLPRECYNFSLQKSIATGSALAVPNQTV